MWKMYLMWFISLLVRRESLAWKHEWQLRFSIKTLQCYTVVIHNTDITIVHKTQCKEQILGLQLSSGFKYVGSLIKSTSSCKISIN